MSKIENHAGLLVLTCDKMGRRSVGRTREDAGPLDMISVFVTLCFPSKTWGCFYHFITVLLHAQIKDQGKSEIEIVKIKGKIQDPWILFSSK